MPRLVVLGSNKTRADITCQWSETFGDIRHRVNELLTDSPKLEEGDLFHAGVGFGSTGPKDGIFIADELFTLLSLTLESNQPEEIEINLTSTKTLHTAVPSAQDTNVCLVFPGQGVQRVGMVTELLEGPGSEMTRDIFKRASTLLGYDLLEVCQNGPENLLQSTSVCQPAVVVTSIASLVKCGLADKNGVCIKGNQGSHFGVAGFSVGEYTALVFAGALEFDDCVRLVKVRAEAMQRASELSSGSMVSISGLTDSQIATILSDHKASSPSSILAVAAHMFPQGRVLSGSSSSITSVCATALSLGAANVRTLHVGGAFHSPLMAPVTQDLKDVLSSTPIATPCMPVVSNVTGAVYCSPSEIRELLARQVSETVQWERVVDYVVHNLGVVSWVDVGPGRQMTAMLKRCDPNHPATCLMS